jgi:hypothetical protein
MHHARRVKKTFDSRTQPTGFRCFSKTYVPTDARGIWKDQVAWLLGACWSESADLTCVTPGGFAWWV